MAARSISRSRKVFFALVPLCLLLASGEIAARVWLYHFANQEDYIRYAVPTEFPTAAKYCPHHYLCYTLQPNYQRGRTEHNSLGFRGPEITKAKPEGTFRIAILGGSTTYCEFIEDDRRTFPAQIEALLRQRGHAVEVINAGCPGYNSWESLINLQFRVLELQPDLVILFEGVNDVHARLVRPSAYRPDNSGRRTLWTTPIEVTLCQYSCLSRIVGYHLGIWRLPGVDSYVQAATSDPGVSGYSVAIGTTPETALAANPPTFLARNLKSMIGVSKVHHAKVFLTTWPHTPECGDYAATPHYERGFRENNEVVRCVAEELNVPLFDLEARMPTARHYWRDGRHVNEEGATVEAALFADFILKEGFLVDPVESGEERGQDLRVSFRADESLP